ncbi:MAG TPA: rhomboid family intramembrane serine protease [Planctomycetota bacterium]|nr:rhomboid family intramembrane serine protease [Planctomycetota bacterium]
MGIHDRDYYRKGAHGGSSFLLWTRSPFGVLISINIVVWLTQVVGGDAVTSFLSARPRDVFGSFEIWRLVTANFAHAVDSPMHILFNMYFLYFLGTELERIYHRHDIYILYLGSGVLAILAELTSLHLSGAPSGTRVLGASGAVLAVTVLVALHYPSKTVLLFFFLPVPIWLCCVIFVAQDILGLLGRPDGVAHLAHLTGACVGLLYKKLDLRWIRLREILRPGRRAARTRPARGKIIEFSSQRKAADNGPGASVKGAPRGASPETFAGDKDSVSQKIDQLLGKISVMGKESLTEEEWEFLRDNAGRYRSQ